MSRPVSYTSAVTVNIASFSGITSNVTTGTSYSPSNGINSSANTSNYATFSATSTNSGYAYYLFNVIEVPSIATINSVSCTVRTRTSATNSGTSSYQLFAGSTQKGTQTTVTSTSTTTYNLTSGTSWTAQDINDGIALRIGVRRASNNRAYSNRFYGATLTVNYTVDGIAYEINTSSETSLATVEPSSQEILQGESGIVKIETDNIGDIVVEDNGVDVTDQLVVKQKITSGTTSKLALTNTTTGVSSTATSFYMTSNNPGYTYINLAGGYSAESPNSNLPTGTNTGDYVYVKDGGSNNTTGWIIYSFDFSSIPSNATITSMEVKCYGAKEEAGTSGSQHVGKIGLYSNNTLKSTEQEFTSSSNQLITISNPGTWTRSELQNAKLRFTVGYYGGRLGGITWTVNYDIPAEGNPYYYEYTVSNISADHEIVVAENVIVPPEEDPDKTYYPITISSINATTNPAKGTVRVESGTSQTITITPSDPQLTLALDNGVDVTNQLVAHGTATPSSAITNITTSYGFTYNSSTGYYVSNNAGVGSSAAVARITFDLPVRCIVTFQYINYAEATYDFGVFSKVDTALSTSAWNSTQSGGDTTTDAGLEEIRLNTSSYNTANVQTLSYEIPAGEHFIDVKYAKDEATNSNNDSLQFKITNIELLEPTVGYYTYDLNNISQSHSLIFIFGDVTYYFVTSNTNTDAKLYPNGQMVALPGDDYRLTIVPEKSTDTVSITDNGTDVTGNLERKEVQTEKEGQTITTVNYIYRLTNIQAAHTLNVLTSGGQILSVMSGGTWVSARKVFKRDERGWNEISNYENLFDSGKIYIPKRG